MSNPLKDYEVNINIELQNRNKSIWKDVFVHREKTLDDLPQTDIFDGWRRSFLYGLNPYVKFVEQVLDEDELRFLLDKNSFFLDVSWPMLENLYNFVYDSGFNVAISDKNGILLTVYGESTAVNSTKAGNWVAGANWSESSIGNNAIGTSLYLNKPVMMIGYEHFCHCCHYFASAAVPIHDVDGELLGSIALCGRYQKIHYHTLGMVVAAAKAIEIQLKINRALQEKEQANIYQQIIFNSINDGIISTNVDGYIRFYNNKCCQLLKINQSDLIGKNITNLLDENSFKLLSDPTHKIEEKIMSLKIGDRYSKCICTSQHIKGTGQFDGIVIAFRDYDVAVQMAKKIVNTKPMWLFRDLIGKNPDFLEVLRIARIAATSGSNVFILGESGTGKDVLAQAIHNESSRCNEPFVAINCGAIPKDLVASELFGYSEGAFTGAKKGGNMGKFQVAKKGTVFLDEIGEMPLEQQIVLLRVLDESFFTPVGSTEKIPFYARIIVATNKNISQAIQNKEFRQDLFYRLNVFTITTVPLRNRKDDIEELSNSFLKRISEKMGYKYSPLRNDVLDALIDYDWPGNIRELQNVLERAAVLSQGSSIHAETLRINNLLPQSLIVPSRADASPPLKREWKWFESNLIIECLERNKWNISKACQELYISRSTLYRWMNKYNIHKTAARKKLGEKV